MSDRGYEGKVCLFGWPINGGWLPCVSIEWLDVDSAGEPVLPEEDVFGRVVEPPEFSRIGRARFLTCEWLCRGFLLGLGRPQA